MSEALAFDSHQFVKHLTDSGFTEEQAEALATEQVALLTSNLATKAELALVQREIEALRQETKANIETLRQETKAELALVQREIEALRQETKANIEALRQETKAELALVQREIEALRQETKANIEALRQETKAAIEGLKSDLLKWLFGALIAQGGLIVALMKLFAL